MLGAVLCSLFIFVHTVPTVKSGCSVIDVSEGTLQVVRHLCPPLKPLLFIYLIDIQLVYSVVLVPGVQQSDSVLHICVYIYRYIFFFRLLSIIGYYKILNIVPCAIQQALVVYLFYIQQCVSANPKLLIYPSPPFPLVTISLFSMSVNLFLFCK